jgi:glyoxylase-like metal-dependent hydrolase (beta-lactamase superfamily II)
MAKDTIRVGNVEITQLSDGMLEFDLCNFFPTIPEAEWQPYEAHLHDHRVRFNLGSYLIRAGGRNILVDTGLGPRPADTPDVPWGELMGSFAATGLRPEDIDTVVMTHLHRDHIGWNLKQLDGRVVPTFPRARYWMSRKDWEACHQPDVQPTRFPNAPQCVWPLEELGLIEFMDGEHTITPELTAVPTPGHTPGHVSILVTSGNERALVLGDAAHSPVQLIDQPDWVSRADMDPDLTRQTRRALADRLEREKILVAAGHFESPGYGRVIRLEGKRRWQGL